MKLIVILLIAFLPVSTMANSEFFVIHIEGDAALSPPDTSVHYPVAPGALIPGDWRVTSESPATIKLACDLNTIAEATRYTTPADACAKKVTLNSQDLVRYRQDFDNQLPIIVRPRSAKVRSLLPVVWEYDNGSPVDISIIDYATGDTVVSKQTTGEENSLGSKEVTYKFGQGSQYHLKICHMGAQHRCTTTEYYPPITTLTKQEQKNLLRTVAIYTDTSPELNKSLIRSGLYYTSSLYDDVTAELAYEQEPQTEQLYLLARAWEQLGLVDKAQQIYSVIIQSDTKPNHNSLSATKALACIRQTILSAPPEQEKTNLNDQTNYACGEPKAQTEPETD